MELRRCGISHTHAIKVLKHFFWSILKIHVDFPSVFSFLIVSLRNVLKRKRAFEWVYYNVLLVSVNANFLNMEFQLIVSVLCSSSWLNLATLGNWIPFCGIEKTISMDVERVEEYDFSERRFCSGLVHEKGWYILEMPDNSFTVLQTLEYVGDNLRELTIKKETSYHNSIKKYDSWFWAPFKNLFW